MATMSKEQIRQSELNPRSNGGSQHESNFDFRLDIHYAHGL